MRDIKNNLYVIFAKIITRCLSDVIDTEEMERRFVASSRDLFSRPPFISVSFPRPRGSPSVIYGTSNSMVESRRRMREKGRERERASERPSKMERGRKGAAGERRNRWMNDGIHGARSRRDISHIAHRRHGILLNFGISSLSDHSRPRVLPIPRRILPFTTPREPRNAGWTLRARKRKPRGRIDMDWIPRDVKWTIYFYVENAPSMRMSPRRKRISLTIIFKLLISKW